MEDNNRFSIYEMIGKKINFTRHGKTVGGLCQHVIRWPLDNSILIIINGLTYPFPEPTKINSEEGKISFLYGSGSFDNENDLLEFCGEALNIEWGEDIRKSIGREKKCFVIDFIIEQ
ncbi:MAG: hypothetical protein M0P12_01160 [Paludibacteraceae bacterium]|nr:hypothetical protein [Paludibacteraceae bacterium]MCK9615545.1 hypothetical protein [Candidatus Omnitrophota bacterium]